MKARPSFKLWLVILVFVLGIATQARAGSIIGWGNNDYGQASPPSGNNFISISAGVVHSLALRSDGSIVGWGDNEYGQASPPSGNNFIAIAAGRYHSLALRSDGTIVGLGDNEYGQASPPSGNNFIAIAAGRYHSLALRSDGTIVGWGYNEYGQASTPSGNNFIAIAAGWYHSLGLRSDGTIVGWGRNDHGQSSPPSGNNFVSISAGFYHSLAIYESPKERLVPQEYPTIQAAIDAAIDGDTVIIAPGTYTGDGNRDIDFLGKAITVQSIDPNDTNIVAATIIDCQGTEANPHRGFYFQNGESPYSVLSGLTITNSWAEAGGGIFCYESSPKVRNCTFCDNSATGGGGGICNYYSSPMLKDCTFTANSASYGGGIYNGNSNPTVTNCTFSGNEAEWGGGMENESNSNPNVINCTFNENSATMSGGGIRNHNSSPNVLNCLFFANEAQFGGAIHNENNGSKPIFTRCTFIGNTASNFGGAIRNHTSSPTVLNSLIIGNQAQCGGGIHNENSSSNPTLINCTLTRNSATVWGGGIINHSGVPILNSCILWGNSDNGGLDESAQIHGGTPVVRYCCIKGWTGGLGGIGNIGSNPLFVAPDSNDFHLLPDSPCIDVGDPNSYFGLEPEPDGGRINMGAYGNTPEATCKYGLVLQSYNLVSKTRVGRTEFEYVYTMTLNNNSTEAVSNVVVELLDASANVIILDPDVTFAHIEAGESAVSDDTFSIIVDRAIPIDATIISWRATYDLAGGGGAGQTTFTTAIALDGIAADIIADGVVDFADLAKLAEQWLSQPGDPSADIAPQPDGDEIVNFLDFALFAENWQGL